MTRAAAAKFASNVAKSIGAHDILSMAGAVAFYTALSFAPLVLLLLNVGALLGEGTKSDLLGLFSHQLGPRAGTVAESVVEASARAAESGASTQWWYSIFSSIGLLITASAVFAQLQAALNRVWEVDASAARAHRAKRIPRALRTPRPRPAKPSRWYAVSTSIWRWLRKRLISMGMVLVVLFILLVSLVVSSVIGSVSASDGKALTARAIDFGLSVMVATLLFAAIFKFLPDHPVTWRQVWLGALATSLLFNIGKIGLALYIDKAAVGREYGEAVGSLIALLVWVYYSCATLLLGAELTRQWAGAHMTSKVRG